KFQKILNAFALPYSVLLELDGKPEDVGKNKEILELAGGNIVSKLPNKLEDAAGLGKDHFADIFEAKTFFGDPANISVDLQNVIEKWSRRDAVIEFEPIAARAIPAAEGRP